jgi:putative ABC transport system permease protein
MGSDGETGEVTPDRPAAGESGGATLGLGRRLLLRVPTVVLARRNLLRAPTRSGLAVLAVVIGVVAIGAIGVSGEAFQQQQAAAYEGFGGTATVNPVFNSGDDTPGAFSESELDRIRQNTGSAQVLPVARPGGTSLIEGPNGDEILVGIPSGGIQGVPDPGAFYTAASGEIPANWQRAAVLGSRVAAENDIQPGDQITIRTIGQRDRTVRVAAVLQSRGFQDPLGADGSVFVPPEMLEGDTYDEVILRTTSESASIESVVERLESALNAREETVRASTTQSNREAFEENLQLAQTVLVAIGGLSLFVGVMTISNTMLMSAIEREAEIGVLRAVGYSKLAVVSLLVAEAGMIGLVGVTVGVPVTLGAGLLANDVLAGDPLAFTATGFVYIGVGVVAGVVTSLVGGVYPAWKAANKRPVEVLG